MLGKANLKTGVRSVTAPVAKGSIRSQKTSVRTLAHGEVLTGRGVLTRITADPSLGIDQGSAFSINPGLPGLFPWVSTQAQGFSKYRFRYLRFTYVTQIATTVAGITCLFGDVNCTAVLPSNFTDAVSYEGALSGSVWTSFTLNAPVNGKDFYLRSGPVPVGQDPKTYDCYQFAWLISGYSGDPNPGYIEVSYEIELLDRRIPTTMPCEAVSLNLSPADSVLPNWGFQLLNQETFLGTGTYQLTQDESTGKYAIGLTSGRWMFVETYYGLSYGPSGGNVVEFAGSPTLIEDVCSPSDTMEVITRGDLPSNPFLGPLTTGPGFAGLQGVVLEISSDPTASDVSALTCTSRITVLDVSSSAVSDNNPSFNETPGWFIISDGPMCVDPGPGNCYLTLMICRMGATTGTPGVEAPHPILMSRRGESRTLGRRRSAHAASSKPVTKPTSEKISRGY